MPPSGTCFSEPITLAGNTARKNRMSNTLATLAVRLFISKAAATISNTPVAYTIAVLYGTSDGIICTISPVLKKCASPVATNIPARLMRPNWLSESL